MVTVLIPTDLRSDSLQLIEEAVRSFPGESMDIVLCLGYHLSDNRLDLISFKPRRFINMQMTDQSKDRQKKLRQKYTHIIKSIGVELFCGHNMPAFQNFLEMNHFDKALIPSDDFLRFNDAQFFSISKFIRRSKLDVVEVEKTSIAKGVESPIKKLSFFNI